MNPTFKHDKNLFVCNLLLIILLALLPSRSQGAIQCYQCHGSSTGSDYRPIDAASRNYSTGGFAGNHRSHMAAPANPNTCRKCHNNQNYTSNHRNGFINFSSNINSSPLKGKYINGGSQVYSKVHSATPVLGTCSSVNCHFETVTPQWGTSIFTASTDCDKCHGAPPNGGATSGAAGSHAKHALYYPGTTNCQKCHSNNNSFQHATSAGKRNLNISFAAAPNNGSGAYSGSLNDYLPSQTNVFGNCTATYCHSPGNKASNFDPPAVVPAWDGPALTCKGCHKSNNASADVMASGSHSRHVSAAKFYTINCNKCHAATVNSTMTITDPAAHVNARVNIKFSSSSSAVNGTYGGQATPYAKDPGSAYGQCNNVYCHSNAQNDGGVGVTYRQPTWGNPASGACGTCHGTTHHGGSEMASGSHTRHLTASAYTGSTKCIVCHNVGNIPFAGSCNNSCHNATSKHTDNKVDILFPSNFGASAAYNGTPRPGDGYSNCSNVSCHFNTATPVWGTAIPIDCVGCHTLAVLLTSGSHAKHISASAIPTMYNYTANRSTAAEYNFGCSNCHPLNAANHWKGTVNVTLKKDEAGVGTLRAKNSATTIGIGIANSGITGTTKVSVICSASYCHSNGNAAALVYAVTPNWYGGTFTGDRCANCHGNAPNTTVAGSASHYNNRFLGYTGTAGGHQIGNHAMSIYSSPGGLSHAGTNGKSSHGNGAIATTISCNICHYATITTARNDNNAACKTCHYTGNTVGALDGNPADIADKSKHVNGLVNVVFKPTSILSKAQMRPASFTTAPYSSAWNRNAGYKGSGSYDSAKTTLDTAAMWDGPSKTCSNIACHNGQSVRWTDNNGVTTCVSCHTSL